MRARAGLALLLVGMWVGAAQAEQVACGNTSQFQRLYNSDPTKVTDPACTVHPKPTTQAERDAQQAQVTLVETFHAAGTLRYLKVPNGWVEEKTQTEKDQVDAAVAADAALTQAYQQELTNQDLCNATALQTITDRVQAQHDNLAASIQQRHDATAAQIDGIATANLASLKAMGNRLNDDLAQGIGILNDRLAQSVTTLARCLRAARGR